MVSTSNSSPPPRLGCSVLSLEQPTLPGGAQCLPHTHSSSWFSIYLWLSPSHWPEPWKLPLTLPPNPVCQSPALPFCPPRLSVPSAPRCSSPSSNPLPSLPVCPLQPTPDGPRLALLLSSHPITWHQSTCFSSLIQHNSMLQLHQNIPLAPPSATLPFPPFAYAVPPTEMSFLPYWADQPHSPLTLRSEALEKLPRCLQLG